MADVQFDTDKQSQVPMGTAVQFVRAENKMAGWLMRRGIVKNESQALYILIGATLLLVAISIWLILSANTPERKPFVPGTRSVPASR